MTGPAVVGVGGTGDDAEGLVPSPISSPVSSLVSSLGPADGPAPVEPLGSAVGPGVREAVGEGVAALGVPVTLGVGLGVGDRGEVPSSLGARSTVRGASRAGPGNVLETVVPPGRPSRELPVTSSSAVTPAAASANTVAVPTRTRRS